MSTSVEIIIPYVLKGERNRNPTNDQVQLQCHPML